MPHWVRYEEWLRRVPITYVPTIVFLLSKNVFITYRVINLLQNYIIKLETNNLNIKIDNSFLVNILKNYPL